MTTEHEGVSIVDHQVWFLSWPGIQALDLVGPHEVFASANRVADGLGRDGIRYRLSVMAVGETATRSESGLTISTEPLPTDGRTPDTLVLPGGDGVHAAAADTATVDSTRRSAPRPAVSQPSAPARFSPPPPACSTGVGSPPIGPGRVAWLPPIPRSRSTPIRST